MCYGWPLNFFFVIDERKNDINRLVSITRVNVIIFIPLISTAFTLLLAPLSSSSLSSLSLSSKGWFLASFLSLGSITSRCSGKEPALLPEFQDVFCRKTRYSLPGFWLEIRIIGSDSPVVENQTARFSKVGLGPHLKNHTLGFKS